MADAVLGLSMTPTSVGLVLVNGSDVDGTSTDGNKAFEVRDRSMKTSAQATAAVLRTEAMAATRGVRLHSIGVTWSEDADAEATQLMKSLSESGFDNVVAIRLPEATEALARGIADVIGYDTTAVCVIERDVAITLIVHTRDGAVQTAVNHAITSDDSLLSWLSSIFTKADWQPEALVVVGSGGGFESILPKLESALSVPVFAPEDAQLALARGAALASAQNIEFPLIDLDELSGDMDESGRRRLDLDSIPQRRNRRLARTAPLALLVAAIVTFVVSASIAITLALSPQRDSGPADPTSTAVDARNRPAEAQTLPAPAAIPAPPSSPPLQVVTPQEEAPPPPPPEVPFVEAVPPDSAISGSESPSGAEPQIPSDSLPADVPAAIPASPDGGIPNPVVSQVPPKKPPLHTRILDRIRGIGN